MHITHTPNLLPKRGSIYLSKVLFFVLHLCSQYIYILIIRVYVRKREKREKRAHRKKENRDRHSANGTSSPFSIKIFVLKNQCPYSVDYGFLQHSYTHCQLVDWVYVYASVTSHFANYLLSSPCDSCTERRVLANRSTSSPDTRPGGFIWWVNLQQWCTRPLKSPLGH